MTAGTPLPQDAGRRVYDVHEVRVRRVQVPGPVVAHVEYDRRVQAGDPADFARLDEVGRQPGDVSPDAVPAARMHAVVTESSKRQDDGTKMMENESIGFVYVLNFNQNRLKRRKPAAHVVCSKSFRTVVLKNRRIIFSSMLLF